jgi:ketosteroid isomerase-like protein
MLRLLILVLVVLSPLHALAGTTDDVLTAYRGFAEAQNTRDPARIRQWLDDTPDLLWVSDGRSFWGADAILARMTGFQKAEVWRVEPDLAAAHVVELGDGVAMLHMPLTLVIGKAAQPDHLQFLVSLLFRKSATEWRIAALLTTAAKP